MVTLDELFIKYGTDKSSKSHDYAPTYELYLTRNQVKDMLEIGVGSGGSLRAWHDWFEPVSVTGVDIHPENVTVPLDSCTFIHGDITDMRTVVGLGEFDFIVDDGSHHEAEIRMALEMLWPHLRVGGWYAIEDLQAPGFRAGWPLLMFAGEVHMHGELILGRKVQQ